MHIRRGTGDGRTDRPEARGRLREHVVATVAAMRAVVRRVATKPRFFAVVAVGLALASGSAAMAEGIVAARYDEPVERYGHFATGRPHEYARLVATTDRGRTLALRLPDDEVFEDVAPRVVRLAVDGPAEILAIVSSRESGSRLVVVAAAGDRLVIDAQSRAIGTPKRWLNPVGVADLEGDGRVEIAAVITPHIGGPLKVYRRIGHALVEVDALDGFSNHVFGTSELRLSTVASIAGHPRLVVPDASRGVLRIVALVDDRLVETGRCPLQAPVTGPIELEPGSMARVGTATGTQQVALAACTRR